MDHVEIKINSGPNILDCSIFKVENPKGGVIFIPGAGDYTKELYKEWQEYLAANNYSSIVFDFPSIGKSTGELFSTSLNSRIKDIETILNYFISHSGVNEKKITLCGRSMGGPLGLRLASRYNHEKLMLLYPAAYAAEAYDKNFGPEFSNVIRKENSWENSPDFELARNFGGKLLVIYGEQDTIIPKGIQEEYLNIAGSKGEAVIIEGAGHNKFLWEDDEVSSQHRYKLFDATLRFLDQP